MTKKRIPLVVGRCYENVVDYFYYTSLLNTVYIGIQAKLNHC